MSRFLFSLLLILLTACNLPQPPAPSPTVDSAAVATVAAATLTAISRQTPQFTATLPPSDTPSPSPSPTYVAPLLTLKENTNCRSGPGEIYPVIVVLKKGEQPALLGRSPGYWIVSSPQGECWLAQTFVEASGSLETLPTAVIPASPTPRLPAAPNNLRYTFACVFGGGASVSLTWNDAAQDEQGYRVYRGETLVAELAANSGAFTDTVPVSSGTFVYRVEAFNATGGSPAQVTVNLSCQ